MRASFTSGYGVLQNRHAISLVTVVSKAVKDIFESKHVFLKLFLSGLTNFHI